MAAGDVFSGLIALAIGFFGGWFFILEPKWDRFIWSVVGVGGALLLVAGSVGVTAPIVIDPNELRRLSDIGIPFARAGFSAWAAYSGVVVFGYIAGCVYASDKRA